MQICTVKGKSKSQLCKNRKNCTIGSCFFYKVFPHLCLAGNEAHDVPFSPNCLKIFAERLPLRGSWRRRRLIGRGWILHGNLSWDYRFFESICPLTPSGSSPGGEPTCLPVEAIGAKSFRQSATCVLITESKSHGPFETFSTCMCLTSPHRIRGAPRTSGSALFTDTDNSPGNVSSVSLIFVLYL